jgi:hypothetical protein
MISPIVGSTLHLAIIKFQVVEEIEGIMIR